MIKKKFVIAHWDICPYFLGLSDVGYRQDGEPGHGRYSRARTYDGECHQSIAGKSACPRRGICVRAKIRRLKKDD